MQLAALVLFLTRPEFAERAQCVKALSLAGNSLTDHHLAMLLGGLQGFAHLERVDLSFNLLGSTSVQLLNEVLIQNRAKCVRFFSLRYRFLWATLGTPLSTSFCFSSSLRCPVLQRSWCLTIV